MGYGTIDQCIGGVQEMKHENEWIASLMRTYYNDMFNYGKTFTRDENVVKDSIQKIFISLWQRRHTPNEILSAKFYFLRAVKNKILKVPDNAERRKSKNIVSGEYEFMYEFPIEKGIFPGQMTTQYCNRLNSMVTRLSEKEKEVVYLKYYQLLGNAQIAELMNITGQSVCNLLDGSILKLGVLWRNEVAGR